MSRGEQMDPEQSRLLKEAVAMVQQQAFQMKRALDGSPPHLMDALKHAANMINELRTGLLGPRAYEELYRLCCEQLRHLETFLLDMPLTSASTPGSTSPGILELYELVQYAGNILPRLYLLITVGSVLLRRQASGSAASVVPGDLLNDLVELCRGVQHPTRGLFLRAYLADLTRLAMPTSEDEATLKSSVEFVLGNFTEMNKLWVRLQHGAGPIRTNEQRERERRELSQLVGKNLQRLSQLDGLTSGIYSSAVLPRVLAQLIQCADPLAQSYLFDITVQCFADDYHVKTLDALLDASAQLHETVDVASLLGNLLGRLARFLEEPGAGYTLPQGLDLFSRFMESAETLPQRPASAVPLAGLIQLDSALLQLVLRVHQGDATRMNAVFGIALRHVKQRGLDGSSNAANKKALTHVLDLLRAPLSHFRSVRPVLTLPNYAELVNALPDEAKRRFCSDVIDRVKSTAERIPLADEADVLLTLLRPLYIASAQVDEDDLNGVVAVLSLLRSDQADEQFRLLSKALAQIQAGGPQRLKMLVPPLLFHALRLAQSFAAANKDQAEGEEADDDVEAKKARRVFKWANDAVVAVREAGHAQLAFRLYLQCALAAGKKNLRNFAYGFLTKGAISLYEEDTMTQSQMEFEAIRLLIGTVRSLDCFDEDSYSFLSTRLAQHASKLLNLDDQARAVVSSAHLFTQPLHQDRLISCLKKSVTQAGNIHEPDVMASLLVDLLDHLLHFHATVPSAVDSALVNALIKKIQKQFSVSSLPASHPAQMHFASIQAHVRSQPKRFPEVQF